MKRACAWPAALLAVAIALLPLSALSAETPTRITVGSKAFTESVILAEVLRHLARHAGAEAVHQRQLGGTRVVWNALLSGDIDAYPEYTGTLLREILAGENLRTQAELQQALAARGVRMTDSLGFTNSYAIGVKQSLARQLDLRRISDLKSHPELVFGFGNEFMNRADGWPGLQQHYHLPQQSVRGLDHDLAYRGIDAGTLQVIDLYATDAEIEYYKLLALEDDLDYFPVYDAVIVYRADLEQRAPEVVAQFQRLAGAIDEVAMSRMNARVKLHAQPDSVVAGIKTSAVINVGTATLGALIGAGGYGQPILTGIRLDDISLILQGAVPAALLALLVQGLFETVERGLLPKSLRLQAEQKNPVA